MKYRSDIQILRGIAVALVVLYHLNISTIRSGFLGVDMFFVISGFLMGVLYQGKDTISFFQRRAKRLLPAYGITLITTVLASCVLVLPSELDGILTQATASLFLVPNIYFWTQNSYFSAENFNPLLHFWSLGVEIQYYLVFPILVYVFSRCKPAKVIIIILSMIACFALVKISTKSAFFIMPFRVWEFLIGYAAAVSFTTNGQVNKSNATLSIIAICLLLASMFFPVSGGEKSILWGHPGLGALFVCILTFIIIVNGIPKYLVESKIGKILIWLGDRSYSVYLVHFPLILLYTYTPFEVNANFSLSYLEIFTLLAATLLLSVLLYELIEKQKMFKASRKTAIILYTSVALSIVIGSQVPSLMYINEEAKVFFALKDRSNYRCGTLNRLTSPTSPVCELTELDEKDKIENVLLVGNSHADAIKKEFTEVATSQNNRVYFMVSNRPLMARSDIDVSSVMNIVEEYNINKIVLHYKFHDIKVETIEELLIKTKQENIKVALIEPVPIWDESIPKAVYYNHELSQSIDDYNQVHKDYLKALSVLTDDHFKLFPVSGFFCDEECSFKDEHGNLFYFDSNHLTLSGAKKLKRVIENTLHW
ncbi:acyltransferase [Vibrio parahaemolyticus]|nr:acyltransferase [Vibrio parahaemolyticus]